MMGLLEKGWLWMGFPVGASVLFALDAAKREAEFMRQFWASIVVVGVVLIFAWFAADTLGKAPSRLLLIAFFIQFAAGLGFGFVALRKLPGMVDRLSMKFTRKTKAERNRKTDVREIQKHLPPVSTRFNPSKFFDLKRGAFVGLGEDGKPLFVEKSLFPKTPHMLVAGASGGGKGVALAVLAAQWLRQGEAVFMIDPKDDEWAPHAFAEGARAAGARHSFVNLRADVPQFSIFEGANAIEVEELLIAGFGFSDTGAAADFYTIADRKYAGIVARQIVDEHLTPAQAYAKNAAILEDQAPKLGGKLRELAEVAAANAPLGTGVSLARIVADGGSCYFVGSMRSEKIKRLQKMLLLRLIQISETRDRISDSPRPVAIILDETKYHLSRAVMEGMGAARDKGVHLVMAFQSLADLRDCGADLNPDAVVGAVLDNSKVKLVYRVENPETADYLAQFSGDIQVDDEARTVGKNVVLAEGLEDGRTIRQAERSLMDRNILQNLHPITGDTAALGVVYGLGIAKFVTISPLVVNKDADNIKVCPVQTDDNTAGAAPSFAPFVHEEELI